MLLAFRVTKAKLDLLKDEVRVTSGSQRLIIIEAGGLQLCMRQSFSRKKLTINHEKAIGIREKGKAVTYDWILFDCWWTCTEASCRNLCWRPCSKCRLPVLWLELLDASTQGIQSHEDAHEKRGEKPDSTRRPKFGKVKVKGPPPSQPRAESTSNDADVPPLLSRAESASKKSDDDIEMEIVVVDLTDSSKAKSSMAKQKPFIIDANGVVHEPVAEESGNVVVLPGSSTAPNLSVADRIEILDYYHACVKDMKEWLKSSTFKWVKTAQAWFNHPKFSRQTLSSKKVYSPLSEIRKSLSGESDWLTHHPRLGFWDSREQSLV
jgi:hypothetical protein